MRYQQWSETQTRIREAFDSLLAEYAMPDDLDILISPEPFSASR